MKEDRYKKLRELKEESELLDRKIRLAKSREKNKIKASEKPEVIKNIYDDEDNEANAENIDNNLSENDSSNDEMEQEINHRANKGTHVKSLYKDIEGVFTVV